MWSSVSALRSHLSIFATQRSMTSRRRIGIAVAYFVSVPPLSSTSEPSSTAPKSPDRPIWLQSQSQAGYCIFSRTHLSPHLLRVVAATTAHLPLSCALMSTWYSLAGRARAKARQSKRWLVRRDESLKTPVNFSQPCLVFRLKPGLKASNNFCLVAQ